MLKWELKGNYEHILQMHYYLLSIEPEHQSPIQKCVSYVSILRTKVHIGTFELWHLTPVYQRSSYHLHFIRYLASVYCYNFVGSTFMKRNIWVLKNPSVKVQNSTQLAHSWSLVNVLNSLSFTEICSYCTLQAWIGPFEGLAIICIMQLSLAEYWQIACD